MVKVIEDTLDCVSIAQLKSSSSLLLPCQINGLGVKATVDTGAEVTVISDTTFDKLPRKPPVL